jgi:hypothetical protein
MEAGTVALGVLAPESDRAMVVISPDGEPAVGLRERLDRGRVVIKDARPGEARAALTSCRPWPWMVIGAVPELPEGVAEVLDGHPVLVLWLGPAPRCLPTHGRSFPRFAALAAAAGQALDHEVGGMRLATGAGVLLPGMRGCSRNPELQALVSAHPGGFNLQLETFRPAVRALRARGIPLRPRRDPATGMVSLR